VSWARRLELGWGRKCMWTAAGSTNAIGRAPVPANWAAGGGKANARCAPETPYADRRCTQ
jgi:hypothetical protein